MVLFLEGKAEVSQLAVVLLDEDVLGFDVAVHYLGFLELLQCLGDLLAEVDH